MTFDDQSLDGLVRGPETPLIGTIGRGKSDLTAKAAEAQAVRDATAAAVEEPGEHPSQRAEPAAKETGEPRRLSVVERPVPSFGEALAGLTQVPSKREARGEGWRARLGVGPSRRAVEAERVRRSLGRSFERPIVVTVANAKGGGGKTPTASAIAGAFGTVRGSGVVVLDVNPTGNLALRTEASGCSRSIRDLAAALPALERPESGWTDLAAFLRFQAGGKWHAAVADQEDIIVREDGERVASKPSLTRDELLRILTVVGRYADVIVLDTGNNVRSEEFLTALECTDVLVLPTSMDRDTVEGAQRVLAFAWDLGYDELARAAVVVETHRDRTPRDPDARAFREQLTAPGFDMHLVSLPPDRAVDSHGPIRWERLSSGFQRSARSLAADVAERASGSV